MDIHYYSSTIAVIFLIIFMLSFVFLANSREKSPAKSSANKKLPPGPWKLPILGNLHNLLGSSQPHRTLRDLSRKYGPLMHLQLGEVSTLVVSSSKMAREVMQTHDLSFAYRPRLLAVEVLAHDDMNIAFAPCGDYWKQMKRIAITELLSPKKVESFSRIREEEVRCLVDLIRSRPIINLTEGIFKLMSSITFRAAFGIECEDGDELMRLVKEASELSGGFALADLFPSKKFLRETSVMRAKLEKIRKKSDKIIESIIDEHLERPVRDIQDEQWTEDFVDVLLRLQRSGSLEIAITTDHIKAVVCDIFAGGVHTSSATVEWAMAEMMKNPRVMEKAQAEIRRMFKGKKRIDDVDINKLGYLKLVIKETLRLHPPAALLVPRECREACEIEGFAILENTKVIVNAWAIGRDPKNWDNPESFSPERFNIVDKQAGSCDFQEGSNFEYIPFGAGRRVCPGNLFAMAKIERTLAELLYHFNWEIPGKLNLDITENFGITVELKRNLSLVAIPFHGN